MDSTRLRIHVSLFSVILCAWSSRALANLEDVYERDGSTVFEGGLHHYGGPDDASFSGTNGYFVTMGVYSGRKFLRWGFLTDIGFASGHLRFHDDLIRSTLIHSRMSLGFNLHPLESRNLSPFIGAHGIGGWHLLKSESPPENEFLNKHSFHYGYELFVGVDMGFFSRRIPMRMKFSYQYVLATYAGTAVDMGGYRYSFGLLF